MQGKTKTVPKFTLHTVGLIEFQHSMCIIIIIFFFLIYFLFFIQFLQTLYKTTQPFDPEGVLGTINSIVMGFFGMQVSYIHRFATKTKNWNLYNNYTLYLQYVPNLYNSKVFSAQLQPIMCYFTKN